MAYWEFLLQKQGDHTWLPLESGQVEILAGRYRVMAHCQRPQTPVQIRISQLLLEQLPPKRRVLKRIDYTNTDGLLVVMPFTWLQAGVWELRCSNTDDAPENWVASVRLQVLAQDLDGDDWHPWPTENDDSPDDDAVESDPTGPVDATMELRDNPGLQEEPAPPDQPGPPEPEAAAIAARYTLALTRRTYLAQRGAFLQVAGQIEADQAISGFSGRLVLTLRDPQQLTDVAIAQQSLAVTSLPAPFCLELSLPQELDTRLLLGELCLLTEDGLTLAAQPLTVTVGLDELLTTLANQAEPFPGDGGDDLALPPEAGPPTTTATAEASPKPLDLPLNPAGLRILRPKSGFTLPPQIYRPAAPPTAGKLSLPDLPQGTSGRDPVELSSELASLPTDGPAEAEHQPGPETGKQSDSEAPDSATAEADASEENPTLGLNWQSRFWQRLSTLAVDSYQSAIHRQAEMEAAGVQVPSGGAKQPSAEPELPTFTAPLESPIDQEVVIYDDPPSEEPAELSTAPADAASGNTLAIDDDDILVPPTPQLEMPEGDLVAGQTITLRLRVPLHPNRLYCRLWLIDPQSRAAVGDSRQIMDLVPDGEGGLTATVSLQVPLGCLQVRFAAIAIDMVSQQESYRALVERAIAPTTAPSVSFDELDL